MDDLIRPYALFALLSIAGTAAAAPKLAPLPQPVQRIQFKGFSIQPQDVSGWLVEIHTPMALAITRLGGSHDETVVIAAGLKKLDSIGSVDELAAVWKSAEDKGTDPNRFTFLVRDVKLEKFAGASCILSHDVATDNAPHTVSHDKVNLVIDNLTRICIHPADPHYSIYVTYSYRHLPEDTDAASAKQAEAVLDSIQFTPVVSGSYDGVVHATPVPYKTAASDTLPLELLGGAGDDFSRSITCSQNDTCTLFGYTSGSFADSMDGWLTHLTPDGKLAWALTYGGGNRDTVWKGIQTADGGYLTIGESGSGFKTGDEKIFSPEKQGRPMFVKSDAQGKLLWAGTAELTSDLCRAELAYAAQTADGGYLLVGDYLEAYPADRRKPLPGVWSGTALGDSTGWQYSYPMLMKLSADGKPQWLRRYAIDGNGGYGLTIMEMPTGHLFMSGAVVDGKKENLFVSELDPQGLPIHTQSLDIDQHQGSNAALRLADGDYLVMGHAIPEGAPHAVFLALFAPDLKFLSGGLYQAATGVRAMSIVQGPDGKIGIAGRSENPEANKAEGVAWMVDEKGTDLGELWLSGQGNTEFEGIAVLSKGRYRLVGDTNAFGASKFDVVTTTWTPQPSAAAKRLTLASYKPDVDNEKTSYDTAKLDVFSTTPVTSIDVKALKPPAPGAH
jgi:hypothetical protein